MKRVWAIVVGVAVAVGGAHVAWGQGGVAGGASGAGPATGAAPATANAAGQALENAGASPDTLRAYGAQRGEPPPGTSPDVGTATAGAPPSAMALDAQAAVAEPGNPGRELVDTESSRQRLSDLQRSPNLPQIFVHQWSYSAPAIPRLAGGANLEPAPMTLTEAVHTALEHNPGIATQRLAPLRALESVNAAEAAFDPSFLAYTNKDRTEAPNSSALSGVRTNVTENVNWNFTLKKLLRTGGEFQIDWTNNRFVSNAKFQGLIPQYKPQLLFSLNQPLLRSFGSNFAYLLVNVSEITSQQAQYTYRAQLANFVKAVIQAYWNVVNARETLEVRRKSLALAHQTTVENDERVRVGLLAPVAVTEARSQEASREADVIVAENGVTIAELTLQQTVYFTKGSIVPQPVDPIQPPRVDPVEVDLKRALVVAFERRPEIIAQNLDLQSKNLTARIQENQLLPRLDLITNFGLNGLSGNAVTVLVNGQPAQTPFTGPYEESLDRLASTKFYSYSAGVQLEVPIGNAAAKAQYAQARIDVASSDLTRRQLLSDVTLEVQRAVSDVETNIKRLRATRLAVELAEQNLRDQQRRLEVGMATTKDILDFQDQLTTARGNEVQAQTDYNVSLAELARSQGTLLDQYSVVVEVPGQRFVPWWARF
jgi:outer membrane protein TolC